MTRSVVCWTTGNIIEEWVYIYSNPVGDVLRPSMGMDLIYNNVVLGVIKEGNKVPTYMMRRKNKPEKCEVTFQVYPEKTIVMSYRAYWESKHLNVRIGLMSLAKLISVIFHFSNLQA